jgi:uncharacterized protein YuzE
MNYTYDPEADALYVQLTHAAVHRQVERLDGVIADVDVDGHLVGIDVMCPRSGWDVKGIIDDYALVGVHAELLVALHRLDWGGDVTPIAQALSSMGDQLVMQRSD